MDSAVAVGSDGAVAIALKGVRHRMKLEPLHYGKRQPLVDRIGRRRFIVYSIIFAALLSAALAYEPVVRRAQRWRAERAFFARQRQCMAYAPPADRVVYEEDPRRAAALQAQDPAYVSVTVFDLPTSLPTKPNGQPPVQYAERLWAEYNAGLWYPGPSSAGPSSPRTVAFLHERTTPSGKRCLVAVELSAQVHRVAPGRWGIFRVLASSSFEEGSALESSPLPATETLHIDVDAAYPPEPLRQPSDAFVPPAPLRLYAGQADPIDPSRFTIPYEMNGERGVITGVLEDTGTVQLTPDDGRYERAENAVGYATWIPDIQRRSTSTTTVAPIADRP